MNNMDEKNVDITTSSSIIPSKPTRKVNRRSNVNEDDKEKITEKVEGERMEAIIRVMMKETGKGMEEVKRGMREEIEKM
ncbi:hypothetical protein EBV26_18660, partial [bacterium]|nr:hypothetical protein [bacterium]